MKPLRLTLTGLASQYIHMPLAPWCLKKTIEETDLPVAVSVADVNVNDSQEDLLWRILSTEPDAVGLSLYVWNRVCATQLLRRLRAARPGLLLIVGGPEATFSPERTMEETPIDYLLRGAGEESLPALMRCLCLGEEPTNIPGLCRRTGEGLEIAPPAAAPAPRSDLYDSAWHTALSGRMAYVETSRGCPFSCAFCLSGNKEAPDARRVQFMPREEALALLIRLGQSGAETIKLIDRTFNCRKDRTDFLLSGLMDAKKRGDIGNVCYHFEVAADLFDDETLSLLALAPAGLFQMEAGLQSFHAPTLEACERRTDMARLEENIRRILAPGNVHLHIDLIAGLPREDFDTFGRSFDRAFGLHPHQLQLGFLKCIPGSLLRETDWGQRFAPDPPYEILATPWMSYQELRRLHDCAEAVERLHNSGRFCRTIELALRHSGMRPFDLFLLLGLRMAEKQGRWSLDALTVLLHDNCLALGVPAGELHNAMVLDRLATDNTGYLPPLLQGDAARLKAAARAWRAQHPGEPHPRVGLLTNGAAVAVWHGKHPVTQRGHVEIFHP